ncbi:MAG: hypothetical protein ABI863_05620, partial [Ginsengibacter sp.]
WPWIKISTEVRTGYILTVENVVQKIKTGYYLLKTNEGKWFDKTDYELSPIISKGGKLQPLTNDLITPAIKKAIDDHENKQ